MTIESVVRGLEVLRLLNLHGASSLTEISAAAGLSRGTTYRILYTLQAGGFVDRSDDGIYEVTRRVGTLSHGYDDDWIADVARPIIYECGKQLTWPLTFSEHVCGTVVTRVTTDKHSPLVFNVVPPGYSMSMLHTASGRLLLAYAPPEKQNAILNYIVSIGDHAADVISRNFAATAEVIRNRGYDLMTVNGARQTALAVPVQDSQGEVIAAIGLRYFTSAMPIAKAINKFFGPLQDAAARIRAGLIEREGVRQ
jgi:IclR family mhp operon transcriptional activator